jgi:F-type H+-transporting ATPase subunit k
MNGILQLAMGVLGSLFAGSYAALGGGSKATPATPPLNASSSDEADFIKCAHSLP